MRITVGHLLLTAGVGSYLVMGPVAKQFDTEGLSRALESVPRQFDGLKNLFQSGSEIVPGASVAEPAPSNIVPDIVPAVATPPSPTVVETPAPEATVAETAMPANVVAEEPVKDKPVVRSKTRRASRRAGTGTRTRTSRSTSSRSLSGLGPTSSAVAASKVSAVKAPPAAEVVPVDPEPAARAPEAAAPEASGAGKMVGTFVSLKLKTGREVRGILEEQNATAYKLQLPGLGTFDYPKNNVLDIQPVQ